MRPEIDSIRALIQQFRNWRRSYDYYILYVPRRTIECDEELEKEQVRV